jgi:hypothetical protein
VFAPEELNEARWSPPLAEISTDDEVYSGRYEKFVGADDKYVCVGDALSFQSFNEM